MSMTDNMNNANFGIVDIAGNPVIGAAAFIYKGYIISMSQASKHPEVAVYIDTLPEAYMMTKVSDVATAIRWCDQNQDKKY